MFFGSSCTQMYSFAFLYEPSSATISSYGSGESSSTRTIAVFFKVLKR